jgi:hypothetical protein
MTSFIFLAIFFLFCGSDSFAQVYKYTDKEGKVYYTDNPSSPLIKNEKSNPKEEKSKEQVVPKKKSNGAVKDVNQLGEELLEKELGKPPEKQDRRLIQDLREALYGDVSGKKGKNLDDVEGKTSKKEKGDR